LDFLFIWLDFGFFLFWLLRIYALWWGDTYHYDHTEMLGGVPNAWKEEESFVIVYSGELPVFLLSR
jgi:hypothetical protein